MLPLTPTKLGRYEIVDEIGKGAMGVVYLARDPLIGRLVALKTFRIGYSIRDQEMEQFRIRFMREAQSAGILSHPNIVTIHDVVEQTEDGMAFIAMEYVRGTNLKALLQGEQPLALPFIVDIVAQVADALDYAHAHRVIHRDVKPANILITADNRVKITDFGIARLDTSNLTQEGQLLGTPNYMAPEQIQGKEVDYRADLFALGVVLYEMLTRRKPFQGENLTVVSHRIVYDHFTPIREYTKDMPPGIERVLDKALDKEPARRYQRARDMIEDLRRVVAPSTVAPDDLNETQSIAAWDPGLPPPPPLPPHATPPGGVPSATMTSSPTAAATHATPRGLPAIPPPVPPAAAAAPAPAAPRPSGSRKMPTRLMTIVGGLAALLILVSAGVLLWQSWSKPAAPQAAPAADNRWALVAREGHRRMQALDFRGAAAAFAEAERLAPPDRKPEIQAFQKNAVAQAEAFEKLSAAQQETATALSAARQALTDQRYTDAIGLINTVLQKEPANTEASQLLAEAKKQQELQRQRAAQARPKPQATPPAVAGQPGPQTTPAPSETAPAAPQGVQGVQLAISLVSEASDGTLMIRANGATILKTTRFTVPRRGIRRQQAGPARLDRTAEIPAGPTTLQVYVTLPDQAARVKTLEGNFAGGSSHHLDIRVSADGEVSVGAS